MLNVAKSIADRVSPEHFRGLLCVTDMLVQEHISSFKMSQLL